MVRRGHVRIEDDVFSFRVSFKNAWGNHVLPLQDASFMIFRQLFSDLVSDRSDIFPTKCALKKSLNTEIKIINVFLLIF